MCNLVTVCGILSDFMDGARTLGAWALGLFLGGLDPQHTKETLRSSRPNEFVELISHQGEAQYEVVEVVVKYILQWTQWMMSLIYAYTDTDSYDYNISM